MKWVGVDSRAPLGYNTPMITETKKYSIFFPVRQVARRVAHRRFYELAKKHIVNGKSGGAADLSQRIDEVAYGA